MENIFKRVVARRLGAKDKQPSIIMTMIKENLKTKIQRLYDMINNKMNVIVEIQDNNYEDGLAGVYVMKDVEKSSFHDFIDEFEGEIIIKHIGDNDYSIKIQNADYQQTKEKLGM